MAEQCFVAKENCNLWDQLTTSQTKQQDGYVTAETKGTVSMDGLTQRHLGLSEKIISSLHTTFVFFGSKEYKSFDTPRAQ